MTSEIVGLRELLFAQMGAPPLPEYSSDTVVLRACKSNADVSTPPTGDDHEPFFKGH